MGPRERGVKFWRASFVKLYTVIPPLKEMRYDHGNTESDFMMRIVKGIFFRYSRKRVWWIILVPNLQYTHVAPFDFWSDTDGVRFWHEYNLSGSNEKICTFSVSPQTNWIYSNVQPSVICQVLQVKKKRTRHEKKKTIQKSPHAHTNTNEVFIQFQLVLLFSMCRWMKIFSVK